MRRNWILIALFAASWPAGCTHLWDQETKPIGNSAGPQHVDWNGFTLGQPGKGTISTEAFGNRVAVLLKSDRQLSARLYIERYPDVALVLLRTPPPGSTSEVVSFVQRCHEAQCAVGAGAAWAERNKFALRTSDAALDSDAVIKLCSANRATEAALDADVLAGQTFLKTNRPKEASDSFRAGLAAADNRPYEAVDLHLLYAESLRREGQAALAAAEWLKAVELAANLLIKQPPVNDPGLWEHIASNQPMGSSWPAAIKPIFLQAAAAAGLPLPEAVSVDGALWAAIGCWRMDRNELDSALKALKRAETMTADLTSRSLLQVWQAKALVMVGQVTTATAVLVPLVDHPSPLVAGPAAAHLAAIKTQAGAVQQARTLLEQALKLPGKWAGKTDAEADFALALLIEGDNSNGLTQLHAAQNQFSMAGDLPGLLRCLRDEADYWASKEDSIKTEAIKKRMRIIEVNGFDPGPTGKP